MPDEDEIVLHYSIASRSITALWMLEELGRPYRLVDRDLRQQLNRSPDFLAINPDGTVPTLQIGPVVVSEYPAICLYLADRYAYGALSPTIEDPDRGPFLKWLFYATATLEPAAAMGGARVDYGEAGAPPWGLNWDALERVTAILSQALEGRSWLLGERFTAADVTLGSAIAIRLFTKMMPETPALSAYNERIKARPAWRRAEALCWPPRLFPATGS